MAVPPISVDASLKAEVGKEAVEKLIDAIVDAFSPATESLGLLGDAVRLARVEVATAITRRAKAIADENKLRLKAPPLKFLVPFFEKASTENVEDGALVEMWARLLTSAGVDYQARHVRYTSILSEMSANQAVILDQIAHNFGGTIGVEVDPDELFYSMTESRLVSRLRDIDAKDEDGMFKAIMQELARAGVSIVIVQVEMKPDTMWDWTADTVYEDAKSLDFEILRSLGLIDRISTDFIAVELGAITVTLYHMTELGYDFWRACHGVTNGDVRGHA